MNILGFDPGKDKCGIAIMTEVKELLYHQVIPSTQAIAILKSLVQKYQIKQIIMGDQTTSKKWQTLLTENLDPQILINLIDERNSSLEARDLYWEMYPAQGLQKLIPQGLRVPPRPIDDLVAILLIKRYLKKVNSNSMI